MLKVRPTYILVILVFFLYACKPSTVPVTGDTNRPPNDPTISSSAIAIGAGESVRLNGSAVDPDGDPIHYFWSASSGEFSDAFERSTTWQAPSQAGLYEITLEVDDDRLVASSSITIEVIHEEEGTTFPAGSQFPEDDSGSSIRFSEETLVVPEVEEIKVETLPEDDVPPLAPDEKVIVTLDVTPDGLTFDPPADLRFLLPPRHGFIAGEELEVLQYDSDIREWVAAGLAEVDEDEEFAIGTIAHTTIFALIEKIPVALTLSYSGYEEVIYQVEASVEVPELRISKDRQISSCLDTDVCTLIGSIIRRLPLREFFYSAIALDSDGRVLAEATAPMLPDSLVNALDSTVEKYGFSSMSIVAADDRVEGATGMRAYTDLRGFEVLDVIFMNPGATDYRPVVITIGVSGAEALWILDLPDETAEIIFGEAFEQGFEFRIIQVDTSSGDIRVY